jgi:hypothetical protein
MTDAPDRGIPYAAVGEAVVEFALMELAIQTAAWPLISDDVSDGQSGTWRLPTSRVLAKIDKLTDSDLNGVTIPRRMRQTIRSAVADAQELLEKRNDVVHGLWRGGNSPDVVRVREFVRLSGASISDTRYDGDALRQLAAEANSLAVTFTLIARVMWTRRQES